MPESVLILVFFVLFMADSLISAKREIGTEGSDDGAEAPRTDKAAVAGNICKFLIGAAAIVLGAQLLIDNGTALAQLLGVPDAIIGATMIAIGTSCQSFVTTITAIRKKAVLPVRWQHHRREHNGSDAYNAAVRLILGKPLTIERQGMLLDIPACLIVSAGALIPRSSGGKFKRWIGFFIGGLYIAYLVVMFTYFG